MQHKLHVLRLAFATVKKEIVINKTKISQWVTKEITDREKYEIYDDYNVSHFLLCVYYLFIFISSFVIIIFPSLLKMKRENGNRKWRFKRREKYAEKESDS
jgi:hypothetical protein